MAAGGALVVLEDAPGEPALFAVVAVFAMLAVVYFRWACVSVRADDDGVTVRNVWSRHEIPWTQVDGIRIGRHPWLGRIGTVDLADGGAITCTAITVPNIELRPGRGRPHRAIAGLQRAFASHRGADGPAVPEARRQADRALVHPRDVAVFVGVSELLIAVLVIAYDASPAVGGVIALVALGSFGTLWRHAGRAAPQPDGVDERARKIACGLAGLLWLAMLMLAILGPA